MSSTHQSPLGGPSEHAGPSRRRPSSPPLSQSAQSLPAGVGLSDTLSPAAMAPPADEWPLSLPEYERYGRQMILPGFGLPGQLALKRARVAVVGAGGLGCPVLQYLAGAGVGTIAVIDPDTVSLSNLPRQILHPTARIGQPKALSAAASLVALNPSIALVPIVETITPTNALALLEGYDLVVDCTDRPLTRYLLNDAAVVLDVPLVSGAAIRGVGQWAVYGGHERPRPANGSQKQAQGQEQGQADTRRARRACYRCLWPKYLGEGAGSGGACEEQGVLGIVTGLVGVGMAGEAVRVLTGFGGDEDYLHMYTFGASPLVRTVRMRPPSLRCVACGPDATLTTDLEKMDYEAFCAGPSVVGAREGATNARDAPRTDRISPAELREVLRSAGSGAGGSSGGDAMANGGNALASVRVVDTRSETEFGICSLPGCINIPFEQIKADPSRVFGAREGIGAMDQLVFVCRQGNDSLVAARLVAAAQAGSSNTSIRITDVRGGLVGWSKTVDPSFPIY